MNLIVGTMAEIVGGGHKTTKNKVKTKTH